MCIRDSSSVRSGTYIRFYLRVSWRKQALSQVIPKRGTPPSWLVMGQYGSNLMSSRADHISRFSVSSAPVPVLSCSTFHVGRANVGELLQDVVVRFEACGRTLIFRQEGETVIDHVFHEGPTIGILCGLRRIETQHVGKCPFRVDRGNRFLARVIAGMPQQMHEQLEPSLAVVDGLARVVFLLGVIGVEEAADAGICLLYTSDAADEEDSV